MSVIGIIPARLQSSRLPRKLLLAETGKPLLQYAWEATSRAARLDEVIIATDSDEIAVAAQRFGARVEMTREHPSGTDRIAEVVTRCCPNAELVVNIQGDEPELEPETIDSLVRVATDSNVEMATLATPITSIETLLDPSCVKVVCAADGRALYFSRSPIPCSRDSDPKQVLSSLVNEADSPWRLHLGIYAYRRDFLLRLTKLPPSRLELLEKLEQLRALEAGATIQVHTVLHRAAGIDTPADYAAFIDRYSAHRAAA